jgi:hypothetical protein
MECGMIQTSKMRSSFDSVTVLCMFFALTSFILGGFLSGDTGHLYNVARVKLVMKNGSERVGYVPLYSNWELYTRDKLDLGTDVLDSIIARESRDFCFVDTFYTFHDIGNMVVQEDIEKIATDSVQHILFISWQGFSGAGPLDQLPRRSIQKLMNKPILYIQKIEESTYDIHYINQDSSISEHEYLLLFKYGPPLELNRSDEFNSLLYMATGDYYENRHGTQVPMTLLVESLHDFVEYARQSIENLSSPCNSPYIENLLLRVKTIYTKRLKFYEALNSYLDDGDTHALKEFIAEEISGDGDRDELVASITKPSEQDWHSIVESVLRLSAKLLGYNNDIDKMFDEIIHKHDIIVFMHSWD